MLPIFHLNHIVLWHDFVFNQFFVLLSEPIHLWRKKGRTWFLLDWRVWHRWFILMVWSCFEPLFKFQSYRVNNFGPLDDKLVICLLIMCINCFNLLYFIRVMLHALVTLLIIKDYSSRFVNNIDRNLICVILFFFQLRTLYSS